jgi:hypothetical protein
MTQQTQRNGPSRRRFLQTTGGVAGALTLGIVATGIAAAGKTVVNGWYEEGEIYYIENGVEEGVTERGENDIYLIGGNRVWQAQVVEFVPGEPGYSPHWNVNVVHTADEVTVDGIVASDYVSEHYPEALFDDVADIRAAADAALVTVDRPGVVVHCPVVPEETADAPGNTEGSEEFPRPWPKTF